MAREKGKLWRLMPAPPPGFASTLGFTPLQAHLLYNRGITRPAEAEQFLANDASLTHDPDLLPDVDKAVERLKKAISSGEAIAVFGDFDVDGVTATALLTQSLRQLGAKVIPYIPHRVKEGHGLNREAIEHLAEQGVKLLVTVDTGTTSVEEVSTAEALGIDTIITDHHSLPPELPKALALVNPRRPDSQYPFHDLSGVGLAFKLTQALYHHLGKEWQRDLLELVALGTVADVAPLKGENRYLVKEGLKVLNVTQRRGLQEIIRLSRGRPGSMDTEAISYGLAPRLNAAGRMDHAITSLRLLTTEAPEEAFHLAQELEQKNVERQRLTKEALSLAQGYIESQEVLEPLLIVGDETFSPGIVGLIAARLVDQFYRPAIAMSLEEDVVRGSARSIPEFNIVEALGQCRDLFMRFGGHAQAAGFTMKLANLAELRIRLKQVAETSLDVTELRPTIHIDAHISLGTLAGDTFRFIQSLAPFGQGNPMPLFLTRNARVSEARPFGNDSKHLKLKLKQGNTIWDAVAFGQGNLGERLGPAIDVVYSAGVDSWGPKETLRLNVLDFKPSGNSP